MGGIFPQIALDEGKFGIFLTEADRRESSVASGRVDGYSKSISDNKSDKKVDKVGLVGPRER